MYGYAFGFGMFGVGVNWLHISINLFGGVNLVGALFITYGLVAFLALYPAAAGYISRKLQIDNSLRLLLIVPALWTLLEWCRSWIFTGFPWLNLGYSQTDTLLASYAPITGVYGMSWLVCLIAALLVYVINAPRIKRLVAGVMIAAFALISMPIAKIQWTQPDTNELSVALAQAAIPQELKWRPETQERTLDLYWSLSEPHMGKDIILWPETAIPMFYHQARPLIEEYDRVASQYGTALVTGIPYMDTDTKKYYNSIIVVGTDHGAYLKRHLVPFGEYLPLDGFIRPILNVLGIPMSGFSAGSQKPLMTVAGIPAGMSICYEDVFGEEIIDALPDARFLINVSNDAWFGDSLAPHQHLQMARLRAKETGRYLLRATNTGISAIIDEQGKIVSQSPQFEPFVVEGTIKSFTGATPYSRFGNYPVVIMALIILAVCFFYTYRRRKLQKAG